jgi:hypothetical protein
MSYISPAKAPSEDMFMPLNFITCIPAVKVIGNTCQKLKGVF